MATIHKLTKDGATIFPATITDAVVHPQTGKTLTSMIKEYNVSELFPAEGIDGGNKYNLSLAIQVLNTHLTSTQKTGGIKLTFISSLSPYPTEEYFLGKSSWSTNVNDWKQRFEVGDVVADPSGSWEPSTAEAYIDQKVADINTVVTEEVITRQTVDSNLQTQINAEVYNRNAIDSGQDTRLGSLEAAYRSLTESDVIVGARPSSGQQANVIYREPDQGHTPPQFYCDYMWYNNAWVLMAQYDNGIDDNPLPTSNNLVKSKGVFNSMGAYDISADHSGQIYPDLTTALGDVPNNMKVGGMSVKFIQEVTPAQYTVVRTPDLTTQPTGTALSTDPNIVSGTYSAAQLNNLNTASSLPSTLNSSKTYYLEVSTDNYTSWVVTYVQTSDNKYVQYRLMSDEFSITESDWQGVDNEPTAWSENLVKSGGVADFVNNKTVLPILKSSILWSHDKQEVIALEQFELFSEGHYINGNAVLTEMPSYNVYRLKVDCGAIGFRMNFPDYGGSYIYGVYKLTDDTYKNIAYKPNVPISNMGMYIKEVYLNIQKGSTSMPDGITVFFPQKGYTASDGKEYIDMTDVQAVDKYIRNNSYIDLDGYYMSKIPLDDDYLYFADRTLALGCVYDNKGNYLGEAKPYIPTAAGAEQKQWPIGAAYIMALGNTPWYRVKRERSYKRIHSFVNKPYDFNGKTAVFFGDSITDGVISVIDGPNYGDRTKAWPTLLCNKLNMTASNQAISGSCLTNGVTQWDSGVKKIAGGSGVQYDITEDFIFIAFGANDYGNNATIGKESDSPNDYTEATTLFGALNLVACTLKDLYPTKPVFFVLPIWRDIPQNMSYQLDDYRKAICLVALKNGFNVINGTDFGFECSEYLIADKLHPTELGYQVYANQVYNIIK